MMRAIVITLPKSGTRMMTSLLNSHPEIDCRFNSDDGEVGVFHFHNVRWEWLQLPMVLIERDYFDGAVSEMVSPHGERANNQYELSVRSVQTAINRRKLYTELLRRHADLVLKYEDLTNNGEEITELDCPELCDVLGVESRIFTTDFRKMEKMIPKNIGEIRARTIY